MESNIKSLGDWTLREVKEECKKHNYCKDCSFGGGGMCPLVMDDGEFSSPDTWEV